MFRPSFLAGIAASVAMLCSVVSSASAYDTSASGGLFIQKNGSTTAGVILTQHLRSKELHVNGFRTQVSLAVPFATGGRFAGTAELRHGFAGTSYAGAGLGYGRWNPTGRSGALYNVLAGTRIARHTYVEGRIYNPVSSQVGHAGFLGVTYFF
jgi:hypothetical protein